jgi:RNA polymerase sigma factor (sigma-70 family)
MEVMTEDMEWDAPELLMTLYPTLLALAGTLVGFDERDDLVQETLIAVLKQYPRFQGLRTPIAYSKVVLIRRSCRKRRPTAIDVDTASIVEQAAERDISETVVGRAMVAGTLERLPPRQRACLYLRYVVDAEDAAIAAILGCAESTVRSQTLRGLRTLRRGFVNRGGFDAQGI